MYVTVEQTHNKDGQGMANMDFKFNEVELLGFDDLTSGFLELTKKKPVTKYTKDTHIEIDKALKDLAMQKQNEQGGNQKICWFSTRDIW